MGVFSYFKNLVSRKPVEPEGQRDLTQGIPEDDPVQPTGGSVPQRIKIQKMLNSKALAYKNAIYRSRWNGGTQGFEEYEYNMAEIVQAEDTEGFVSRSFDKHIEICMKEGFKIGGDDPRIVRHIKRRLFEIFVNTGLTTKQMVRKIIRDTIKYSNVYIVLVRDETRTTGKIYNYHGKPMEPIAGIFFADPPSMTVKRNKWGKPVRYRQYIYNIGEHRNFKPEDIIHLDWRRKEGHAYGTPFVVPALEDIRSLRRIEEMVEMLISSHIFPLFQYIVGTDDYPSDDLEIQKVKDEIQEMPTEGSVVTSHRHKIAVVGAEGKALEVQPYLQYFEKRSLATLGLSEIALGRGDSSNRNTAESIDKAMLDRCSEINDIIADSITYHLFIHFVLDGGFPLSYETLPEFGFGTLDREAVRANENHQQGLFQGNTITEEEARKRMGLKPMPKAGVSGERALERIDIPKMKAEAEAKAALAASTASQNSTTSKNQPTNQHGTKATKTKLVKNVFEHDAGNEIKVIRNIFTEMPEDGFNEYFTKAMTGTILERVGSIATSYMLERFKEAGVDVPQDCTIIPDVLKNRLQSHTLRLLQYCRDNQKHHIAAVIDQISDELPNITEDINTYCATFETE